MTILARRERAALADTLLAVGPTAPTLCEGWQARDLAAHLVVREHSPLGSTGIWLPALAQRTARDQAALVALPWPELVEQVRGRPAWWHPARLNPRIESLFDDGELFVHHEDVRRGDGQPRPRDLSAADEQSLWKVLSGSAKLALRKSPVNVVVETPGRPRTTIFAKGKGEVVLRGPIGEVLLAAFGRSRAAAVEMIGSPADVAALRAAAVGM